MISLILVTGALIPLIPFMSRAITLRIFPHVFLVGTSFMDDVPLKHGDVPLRYVQSPEANGPPSPQSLLASPLPP